MQKTLLFLTSALLAVAACSAYRPGPLPPVTPETMMISKAESGLTVAADPYVHVERQQSVFDANFKELNVLPVRVMVENTGDGRLLVRYSDMRLELAGGDPHREHFPAVLVDFLLRLAGGVCHLEQL
jgi:hypothetical protein